MPRNPGLLHSRHKHDCSVKYHSWASVRLQQMLGQKINDYRPWKSIVIQDHVALYKDLPLSDHRSPQLSGKQDPQVPQMKGQQQLPKLPRRCRESSTHSRASHQEREWPHSSPCEWAVLQHSTVLSRTLGSESLSTQLVFTKLMLTSTWQATLPPSDDHSQQQWNQET